MLLEKPAARSLVMATRMPPPPAAHTGNPFTTLGALVAACTVDGCSYHVQGERAMVGAALREHHRLFHSDSISVVLLNHARQ